MKQRLSFSILFLILSIPVIAADRPNDDVLARQCNGKVTHTMPGGGSVSMDTSAQGFDAGKADINPNYGHNAPSDVGNSSVGGVVGAIYNVGKKLFGPSERELRADRSAAEQAMAEREMMSRRGDPRVVAGNPEAQLIGNESKKQNDNLTGILKGSPVGVIPCSYTQEQIDEMQKNWFKNSNPAPTPTPEPAPVPKVTIPGFPSSVGSERSAVTCLPMVGQEVGARYLPKAKAPMGEHTAPNMPTILSENPFKDIIDNMPKNDKGPGNGGLGMAGGLGLGGAGLVAAKITTVGTAGGAAAASGGTVAVGGTSLLATVAPFVGPAIVVGLSAYMIACLSVGVYDRYYNPGLRYGASSQEREAYHAQRALQAAAKNPQPANPNPGSGGNNNQPTNPGNPKDPKDPKERKFNTVQKTEGLRKLKENYKYDKQSNLYKLRENGKPIKCTRTGKPVENVKWDHSHGDVEALNGKLKHMGSLDPVTFEMYKAPVIHRKEL